MQIKSWRLQVSLTLIGLIAVGSVATQFMKAQAKHDRASRMHSLFNSRLIPDRLVYYAELFKVLKPGLLAQDLKVFLPEMKTRVEYAEEPDDWTSEYPDKRISLQESFDDVLKIYTRLTSAEYTGGSRMHPAGAPVLFLQIYGNPRYIDVVRDLAVQELNAEFGDGQKSIYSRVVSPYEVMPSIVWKLNRNQVVLTYEEQFIEAYLEFGPEESELITLAKEHIQQCARLYLVYGNSDDLRDMERPNDPLRVKEVFEKMSYPPEQGKWPWDPVEPTVDSVKTSP